MFRCCSLETSHPPFLPQSPKVCSVHLCLYFCFAYRVIVTIFLNSSGWILKLRFQDIKTDAASFLTLEVRRHPPCQIGRTAQTKAEYEAWSTGDHLWRHDAAVSFSSSWGLKEPSEASQKEKKRVRVLLHVAGSEARMLWFAILVP